MRRRGVVTGVLLGLAANACSLGGSESSKGFDGAVGRNDIPAVVEMLRNGQDPNEGAVLISTARTGSADMVRTLVSAGADANITVEGRTETPLHAASQRTDDEGATVVSLLLQAGANPCLRISQTEPDYAEGVPAEFKGLSAFEIADAAGSKGVRRTIAQSGTICPPDDSA